MYIYIYIFETGLIKKTLVNISWQITRKPKTYIDKLIYKNYHYSTVVFDKIEIMYATVELDMPKATTPES